jgi:hypothetical protein
VFLDIRRRERDEDAEKEEVGGNRVTGEGRDE